MGLNFFAHIRPSDRDKEHMKELIDRGRFADLMDFIRDNQRFEVHIGKSSAGWRFLFNHNNERFFQKRANSIDQFLRREDVMLEDEEGRIWDVDDFWEKVRSKEDEHFDRAMSFMENGLVFSTSTDFC